MNFCLADTAKSDGLQLQHKKKKKKVAWFPTPQKMSNFETETALGTGCLGSLPEVHP